MIVDYIDAHRDRFGGVAPICRVLREHGMQIAPSTYYARKHAGTVSATVLAEAYDAHAVYQAYHRNRGVYGVRKLWHTMHRDGRVMGRDQVGRLMKICGITGVVRGAHRTVTTQRDDRAPPRHPRSGGSPVVAPIASRPVVGGRFHLLLDPVRVRLHRVSCRCVLASDPGLAGDDEQDDSTGDQRSRAGLVHTAQD